MQAPAQFAGRGAFICQNMVLKANLELPPVTFEWKHSDLTTTGAGFNDVFFFRGDIQIYPGSFSDSFGFTCNQPWQFPWEKLLGKQIIFPEAPLG